jgi:uncharacterized protein YjiS (DUF1127 family)
MQQKSCCHAVSICENGVISFYLMNQKPCFRRRFPVTVFSLLLASPIGRLIRFAGEMIDAVLEGRRISERYERLSHMTQPELTRIGLTRSDITRAAVQGFAPHHG